MKKIITRKTLFKKALPATFIIVVLGFGLFIYNDNKDLSNFKPYYIRSYITLMSSEMKNLKYNQNNMASVSGAFTAGVATSSSSEQHSQNKSESVPVLTYHGIVSSDDDTMNVPIEKFQEQMETLKKAGWHTVSIYDFYDFIRGKKELPEKSFLLTFDDGRKDSYYPVDPILRAYDYHAVMYVIISRLTEGPFHLSVSELDKMDKSGRWDLQSHGKNDHDFFLIGPNNEKGHFLSNKLWLKDGNRLETLDEYRLRISGDLEESKKWLEDRYKKPVVSFAYPFGDYGQDSINLTEAATPIIDMVAKSFYPISFFQTWEGKGFAFNYPDPTAFMMKRISVKPDWSGLKLLSVLEKGSSKHLPYKEAFLENSGWIKTWGQISQDRDAIITGSIISTDGSAAFLDGTYLWRNYAFRANVYLNNGQIFSLMARYKDDDNYVACSFSAESIRIEQVVNSERKILSELMGNFIFANKNRDVGIGVNGSTVNCYLNNVIAMRGSNLDQVLSHGGIGFKTWGLQKGNSELVVRGVSVDSI